LTAPPRVLVVGDVINDILVETAGPLIEGEDNRASVRVRPGGSAANQAAWMGSLGLDVTFAGRAGAPDVSFHRAELARYGVTARLAADASVGTGSIVVLVGADGERTMITDRGANLRLDAADVPFSLLDRMDLLHLTGYTLFDPGPRSTGLRLIAEARRRGIPFTIDPGSAAFLGQLKPGEFLWWTRAAAVCFPNQDEAAVLTGMADPGEAASALAGDYGAVVVKLGAAGALLRISGSSSKRFPAEPGPLRDTTGAGDAFCAGFLASWLADSGPARERLAGAMGPAGHAAAMAVSCLGGRPPTAPGREHDRGGSLLFAGEQLSGELLGDLESGAGALPVPPLAHRARPRRLPAFIS
jgi:sugar/nucleoside kinase (ribokinase family)